MKSTTWYFLHLDVLKEKNPSVRRMFKVKSWSWLEIIISSPLSGVQFTACFAATEFNAHIVLLFKSDLCLNFIQHWKKLFSGLTLLNGSTQHAEANSANLTSSQNQYLPGYLMVSLYCPSCSKIWPPKLAGGSALVVVLKSPT